MIEIENMTFSYKSRVIEGGFFKNLFKKNEVEKFIFTDLSANLLNNQKILGFLGKNGAGKTTLIKLFTGILTPNSGTIRVMDINVQNRPKLLLQNLGVMFGNRSMLWPELSLQENIDLFNAIYKQQPKSSKVSYYIEMLKLDSLLKKPSKTYSLGQSVKANLLIHMLHEPKLLILDEPTIGLDVEAQLSLRKIIKEYIESAESRIIITSHNMMDIADICTDIIFVQDGILSSINLDKQNSKEQHAAYLENLFV